MIKHFLPIHYFRMVSFSIIVCGSITTSDAEISMPLNIEVTSKTDIRGGWFFPDQPSFFNTPTFSEMKIDIWMKGLGSMDIQMEVTLPKVNDIAGFSVDIDILNFFPRNSWNSLDLTLGTGVGTSFVPSTEGDGLNFDLNHSTEDEINNFVGPFVAEGVGLFPEIISFSNGLLQPRDNTQETPSGFGDNSASSLTVFVNSPDNIDSNIDGITTFTLRVTGKVDAPPVPDIKINGMDELVTTDNPVLTVALKPGAGIEFANEADWWLAAYVSGTSSIDGWYNFDINTGAFELAGGKFTDLITTVQGPLAVLNTIELPAVNSQDPKSGTYIYYLAVDINKNGMLDFSDLYLDSVQVMIP